MWIVEKNWFLFWVFEKFKIEFENSKLSSKIQNQVQKIQNRVRKFEIYFENSKSSSKIQIF